MTKLPTYLISFSILFHSELIIAEPEITVDSATSIVSIKTSGDTPLIVLDALAKNMGFSITGTLENNQSTWNDELKNKPEKLINQLVQPQSVAIIYQRDKHGMRKISSVELIPTGIVDTKYTINASDGEKPLVGTQQQIEKRMAHNERREKNRTKKISEGTLCCDTYYKNKGN